MPGEAERQPAGGAADACDQLCPPISKRQGVYRKSRAFKQGSQALGASTLVPGRIDSPETDEILGQFD
jgi:hypothetical protein